MPWTAGMLYACLLGSSIFGGLWTCIPAAELSSVFSREMAANVALRIHIHVSYGELFLTRKQISKVTFY